MQMPYSIIINPKTSPIRYSGSFLFSNIIAVDRTFPPPVFQS